LNNTKPLRFFEICINPCSLTYGDSPCTAAIGVTGDFKCFNSPRTCQDPANYTAGDVQILRFAEPTADLPIEIEATPCISGISRRPQQIDPGEGLGVRESVTVTMKNGKSNMAAFDKYIDDRGFNTWNRGTFWGKFFAIWGNLQGYEARTIDGFVGQDLEDMTYRYYMVDSHNGPDSNGNVSFVIKDVIKFMDGDRAQCPLPSAGVLLTAIDSSDSSVTLDPVGVGSTYPASGLASMGDEAVTFTRSGDVITFTQRGARATQADDHDEGTTFQIAKVYSGESPADIIEDLLDNFTDTPDEYLDLTAWQDEIDTFIGRQYSAEIMQPTPVKTLITELIQEVGLIFFTDLQRKKIAIYALRQFVPTAAIDDNYIIAGSISSKPLTDKRISDVWVYYGKRNPLEKQDEKKNYSSIYASITSNPVVALENLPRSIRDITSRWITVFNQPAAIAINSLMLSRYETAPRLVSFKIPPQLPLSEGQAITVQSRIFEDSQGDQAEPFICQVLSVSRDFGHYSVMAEEVKFTQIPATNDRYIYITENVFNINLRTVHDSIYTEPESGDNIILVMSSGVFIGSSTTVVSALTIGDWPSGVVIEIRGNSTNRIQAKGGSGSIFAGEDGGDALYTRYAIEIVGDIKIYGGGGGASGIYEPDEGRYYGGGGGAGYIPGSPGATIDNGYGGFTLVPRGGDPGEDGQDATYSGGTGGNAIDGVSYVTFDGTPDIKGAQVN